MATRVDILNLIAARHARRPARIYPALDALFARLAVSRDGEDALKTEDRIWDAWMHHGHEQAERDLQLATDEIAKKRYDIAETRLTILLRRVPDFAEAWHKRATLFYLLGRDEECLHDIRRTLELEPRHFAAILHFVEILRGARGTAGQKASVAGDVRFACFAALTLHPNLQRARELFHKA